MDVQATAVALVLALRDRFVLKKSQAVYTQFIVVPGGLFHGTQCRALFYDIVLSSAATHHSNRLENSFYQTYFKTDSTSDL